MQHEITQRNKEARQEFIRGNITEEELLIVSKKYYTRAGVCPFLGTANTDVRCC